MPSPSVALLRTQTDERLFALAAGGHERAFEAIVERYRRELLRHARRYLPEARAEDALQQALLSAWSALGRGDEVRELRPWLHRIVHNTSLNALRAAGYDYDELRDTLEGRGGPAELTERRAVVRGTLAGLAALPERQRDALLRIAVEGRSQDEVAEELGLTQGAVRQLVHRARTALRAAATAVVPLPLATWLATAAAGRGDVALRVGELAAGAGGGATLAKAGTVAVLAGGTVAGPAVVSDVRDKPPPNVRADSAVRPDPGRDAAPVAPAIAEPAPAEPGGVGDDSSGPGPHDDERDSSGGGRGGDDDPGSSGGRGDDSSGPGRRDDEHADDDSSGSRRRGGDDGSSRSGRRGGDDDSSDRDDGDDDDDEGSSGSRRDDHDDSSDGEDGGGSPRSGGDDHDDSPGGEDGDDDEGSPRSGGDDHDDSSGSGGDDSSGGDDEGAPAGSSGDFDASHMERDDDKGPSPSSGAGGEDDD
jgi:RNA polymerase sigma factor (sigma-70 family)